MTRLTCRGDLGLLGIAKVQVPSIGLDAVAQVAGHASHPKV